MYINKSKIIEIFYDLEQMKIEYALLRDVNHELPEHYSSDKDIDIIIRPEHRNKFLKLMHLNKWRRVEHPLGEEKTIFLYAMTPFEFYIKDEIRLDICYQLSCKSTNAGEWMPIDREINKGMWNRIKRDEWYGWYKLSEEDELIHLFTRCIFDKRNFNTSYRKRIEELLNKVDIKIVRNELNKVFFNFTGELLDLVEDRNYDCIIENYLTFKEY